MQSERNLSFLATIRAERPNPLNNKDVVKEYENIQAVYINHLGQVLYSCNRIFSFTPLTELQELSIMDRFPLLESIFSEVLQLKPGQPAILFRGVEPAWHHQPYYLDFAFRCLIQKPNPLILWNLYDKTNYYLKSQARQQRKNEDAIRQHGKKEY